jgi:hypothetical protein
MLPGRDAVEEEGAPLEENRQDEGHHQQHAEDNPPTTSQGDHQATNEAVKKKRLENGMARCGISLFEA